MLLTHAEEKIVNILKEGMATPKQIATVLGKGCTELKAQSTVLTLARKGLIDKTKAALILHGTKMLSLLQYETGSALKGEVPQREVR